MEESGINVGDHIEVKLIEIDDKGKLRLSHRVLEEKPEGYKEPTARPRPPRREGGNGNGHGPRREGGNGPRREGGPRNGGPRERR